MGFFFGNDHLAPWNTEVDDDDGKTVCYCSACNAGRLRDARVEREIDEYEYGRFSRCK